MEKKSTDMKKIEKKEDDIWRKFINIFRKTILT